jgi:hypothetical protein
MIAGTLDKEFKMFMRWRGINIDSQLFELELNEPQNFAQYRQSEVDSARIQTYVQLEQYQYFSKRFLMQRYLGLDEEEMKENEKLWLEEQGETKNGAAEPDIGLRSVGITPGSITGDLAGAEALPGEPGIPGLGGEVGAPGLGGGVAPPLGGVPAGPGGIPSGPMGI